MNVDQADDHTGSPLTSSLPLSKMPSSSMSHLRTLSGLSASKAYTRFWLGANPFGVLQTWVALLWPPARETRVASPQRPSMISMYCLFSAR
jgi:hypothetical protein